MLKNFWYAVEWSAQVSAAPRRVKVLGQELALYRGRDGQVVALRSYCVHRGGDLAAGQVVNGCLRCPYHGWEFDQDGACVRIPANPKDAPVPRRARVDAYPAQERYGLVWLFLGDLPEAERPPLPPFPEYGQPGWKAITGEYAWNAHYARVVENGLDFAHGPFVHAQSFGSIDRPQVPDYEIRKEPFAAHVDLSLPAQRQKGLWRLLSNKPRPDVPVTLSFYMPNINRIHLRIGPRWQIIIFDSNIPIDEDHTRTLWVSVRNFFPGDWADGNARARTLAIFDEDRPIVETQHALRPGQAPLNAEGELPVKSDQLPLFYRKLRQRCFEQGWGVAAPERGATPSAIACPARRVEPEGSWVLPPTPAAKG